MGLTVTEKIIKQHLIEGRMEVGEEICIRIDQTLLQDATGTMAMLQFEAMDVPSVKPSFCITYVDHNMLQEDFRNADDHLFLQTISDKYGLHFSKPGNGICHHIHTERFTKPGQTLLGADSHTPTAASGSMLAIGAGGLDVAIAMATGKYYLTMPKVIGIKLSGQLKPWVTPKDVILEVLRRIDVTGGVGKVLEYFGPGVKTLAAPERATIGNMGAETGATSSVFPSDERTREFFRAQGREHDWRPLEADPDCTYDEVIEIDLGTVEPLIACPYSPGNVKTVREVAGMESHQAMIGSSTNSSYRDLMIVAQAMRGKVANPRTSFHVIPGSRQTLETISRDGGLMDLLRAGARIAEPSCNACIGMGNAPATGTVSVRSFNRNWKGRSGTTDDNVFLSSPETAMATALKGEITDPRDLGIPYPKISWPTSYAIDDALILKPTFTAKVIRGPNIQPLPRRGQLENSLSGEVLIHLGDNISTDHILPAGAKILPLRSNVPAISEFVFTYVDPTFAKRAKEKKGGFIVGGANYGQGSSREHAALAPMYLGIKAVFAKSFARIHRDNLINFGILPLLFENPKDQDILKQGITVSLDTVREAIRESKTIEATVDGKQILLKIDLNARDRETLLEGGSLNYTRKQAMQSK